MEQYNVLNEFWKMMIEQLRKSGLTVTLLCIGVWFTWQLREKDKKEMTENFQLYKLETGLELKTMRTRLDECNEARMKMYFEVAELRARINFFTGTKPIK